MEAKCRVTPRSPGCLTDKRSEKPKCRDHVHVGVIDRQLGQWQHQYRRDRALSLSSSVTGDPGHFNALVGFWAIMQLGLYCGVNSASGSW